MSRVVHIGGSVIGNFTHFQRDPLDFLKMARGMGDVVMLGSKSRGRAFIINAPDFIREILATRETHFRKGRSSAILGQTVGEGLLTTEGDVHERQRRIMQPAFVKQRIASYADTIVACTDELVQSWQCGSERLLSTDMMDLTLQIIVRTMFGTEIGEQAEKIAAAVDDSIEYSAKRLMSPVAIPTWLPTKWNVKQKRALQGLHEVVYDFIRQAKKADGNTRVVREDLLAMLVGYRDEAGLPLSDEEIRDQIITILIAGHETTANALSWTWYLLSQHPEVEAKFQQELDEVLGGRKPTFEDMAQLKYTQLILQESLRLYPPAWMILREANEAVEICGHTFPKNASMIICPYTVHRNPNFFADADRFVPERFLDEEIKQLPRYAYFPFGGGSRACIGSNFAMLEATLVLAVIGQTYRLRLKQGHHAIKPEPLVSLRVEDGLYMRVEAR